MEEEIKQLPEDTASQLVQTFAFGSWVNLVGKISGRGLFFIGQFMLAKVLSVAEFGYFSIGWNILRFIGMIAPMGVDKGALHFGAKSSKRDADRLVVVSSSIALSLVFGLFCWLLFWIIAPWLANLYGKPELEAVLRIFSIAFPFYIILSIAASISRIDKDMSFGILAEEISQPLINLIFIVAVIVIGRDLLGFVWAATLSFVGGGILALMQNIKVYGRMKLINSLSWRKSIEIFRYSSLTIASTLFGSFMILTDRLFVGFYLHEAQAGIYQGISLISMLFITVLSATKLIVAPMVADYYSNNQQRELNQLFVISTKWPLYICLPALAVVIFAPEMVLGGIFSDIYATGYIALVILGLMHLVNIATGPADQVLIMTGKQVDMLRVSVGMFILNIILNIFLIPRIGLTGAALTTLITYGGASVLNVIIVRKKLYLWPYKGTYVKGAAAFLISGIAVILLKNIQFKIMGISLVLIFAASCIIFICVLWLMRFDDEDNQLYSLIKERFCSK